MNEHRRRLLEQEEQTRKQGLKNKRMARMLIAMSLFSFSLCCLVGVMITIDPLSLKEEDKADRSNLPATVSPLHFHRNIKINILLIFCKQFRML